MVPRASCQGEEGHKPSPRNGQTSAPQRPGSGDHEWVCRHILGQQHQASQDPEYGQGRHCLSMGPGVPTAFWTWRADPVRYGPGPPAPSSVRWPVLTLGTWGTEEARAGVKSGAPLFAVRPHCWVQPLSLSSRVCSWGYFVSLARCKTPANNSTWGRVVCGSGGPQPCVATAQGKMSVPSSALCSRRTMPAGWRLPVPAPQHPRGQGRRKESHPPCLLHLLLGKTPA